MAHDSARIKSEAAAEGTGVAALMSIDLDHPEVDGAMFTVFREDEGAENPIGSCQGLQRSLRADFPTHTFTVAANTRAKYLMWQRHCAGLGMPADTLTPADFAELGEPAEQVRDHVLGPSVT